MADPNPRPAKRLRQASESLSPQIPCLSKAAKLARIPPANLLLLLPSLLAHPPTHRHYAQSLYLSLLSFRRCLTLDSLTPEIECSAWTGLAEVGMRAMQSGFNIEEDHPWAHGIEFEVEKAIGKAASTRSEFFNYP